MQAKANTQKAEGRSDGATKRRRGSPGRGRPAGKPVPHGTLNPEPGTLPLPHGRGSVQNGSDLIVALDPSSTRTGYAVLDRQAAIINAGYLAPRRTKDPAEQRIDAMAADLIELLDRYKPPTIVIEVPSDRRGTGSRAGATGRLAIYGMAVGELRRVAKDIQKRRNAETQKGKDEGTQGRVISVTEQEWTQGKSKANRRWAVALEYLAYAEQMNRDPGADVADAIGLGLWWLAETQKRQNAETSKCRRRACET